MTATGASFRRRVFVVMPFGQKEAPKRPRIDALPAPAAGDDRLQVDFDAVYQLLFAPALEAAGLQPFRADDEETAGDILKDMFAELVTADFVLADISILNANVFYELGIRHTVGPRGVICLHAGWADRPFDVAPQRTFKYDGQLFHVGLHGTPRGNTDAAEVSRLQTLKKRWRRIHDGRQPGVWQSTEARTPDAGQSDCALQALPGASRQISQE
jgi:hypothetical protein